MPKQKTPKERVTIVHGKNNILLACPHGYDDNYTSIITETAAKALDCNALINHAWRRSKVVNEKDSEGNCNNVNHVFDPNNIALQDEYGIPINRLMSRMVKKLNQGESILVLHIHGVGDWIKKQVKKDLKVIIGYGAGDKPLYSCQPWVAQAFGNILTLHGKWLTYTGAAGGKYSARMRSNMNQYFNRSHLPVQSMQLEFTNDIRVDDATAEKTGITLAACVNRLLVGNYDRNNYPGAGLLLPEI